MRLQPAAADADEHHAVRGPALPADTLLPPLPVSAQGEGAGAASAVHPVSQLAAVRSAGARPQAAGTVILFGTTNSRAQLSCSVESSFAELSPWCFSGGSACLRWTVAFNPHFQYFFSPDVRDSKLCFVQSLRGGSALLLLDSFAPTERTQILVQAKNCCGITGVMWISRQADLLSLRSCQSLSLG